MNNKTIGILSIIIGSIVFLSELFMLNIFTNFSFQNISALFFDDSKIALTAIAIFLIIFGIHYMKKQPTITSPAKSETETTANKKESQ